MKCYRLPERTANSPGFTELRRYVVIGAPAALAACVASPNQLLITLDEAENDEQMLRFLAATDERASALKKNQTAEGQNDYVDYLAKSVTDVTQVSTSTISSRTWKELDPGVYLGTSGWNSAFFVVHWQLAPGAFLPPHCHPKTSVCTLGLQGSATLRHFEAEQSAPSYKNLGSADFLIRETRSLELTAGSVSTLTAFRDNIHLFEAGRQGARGIDVTTDYGGDGSFSFLEFDRNHPFDRNRGLYLANWIGTTLS